MQSLWGEKNTTRRRFEAQIRRMRWEVEGGWMVIVNDMKVSKMRGMKIKEMKEGGHTTRKRRAVAVDDGGVGGSTGRSSPSYEIMPIIFYHIFNTR